MFRQQLAILVLRKIQETDRFPVFWIGFEQWQKASGNNCVVFTKLSFDLLVLFDGYGMVSQKLMSSFEPRLKTLF